MHPFAFPPLRDAAAHLLSAASERAPAPTREFADLPVRTSRVSVPTRHGPVPCTVYQPEDAASGSPVHLNLHGGGFVIGYAAQDDPWCRYLATHAGATVVNAAYTTAPRVRFPVPAEQAVDVARWAAAPQRQWDGGRLSVGGQSAGGSLATAVARQALERGGPAIALQVLHYPVLDLDTPPSVKARPGGRGPAVPPMWLSVLFREAYLPVPARRSDRLASPALHVQPDELRGIAPAVVVVAERDRLRAEGVGYARALEAVDALVELIDLPGVGHGYDILGESPRTTRSVYPRLAGLIRAAHRG